MKNEYRIDREYNKIYKLNDDGDAYQFYCTFYQIGVSATDSDAKILAETETFQTLADIFDMAYKCNEN